MPVNYQQALQQIREMGRNALQQEEKLKDLIEQAAALFEKYADELDSLQQLVDRAGGENTGLRCAAPFRESLTFAKPAPAMEPGCTLLAADGSQINPDRHAMVAFGAINVGIFCLRPGSGEAPEETVRSRLLFQPELYTASGSPLTEDMVALMRDLAERQALMEMARSATAPVVTLTDGPLELFHEPKGNREFEEELKKYQDVLEDLASIGAVTAGYVDRPRSDLLIRLLELVLLQQRGQLSQAGEEHPLRWVTDGHLFYNHLEPGERSAIFTIRSGSPRSFRGLLEVHYFYLNVGRSGHPYLSRVEIPRWVAENERMVDLLHACLVNQAHHLGARPFPYALHRAHEIAVITHAEHEQLENMIAGELRRQGIPVDDYSNKQLAKNSGYSHKRSR